MNAQLRYKTSDNFRACKLGRVLSIYIKNNQLKTDVKTKTEENEGDIPRKQQVQPREKEYDRTNTRPLTTRLKESENTHRINRLQISLSINSSLKTLHQYNTILVEDNHIIIPYIRAFI